MPADQSVQALLRKYAETRDPAVRDQLVRRAPDGQRIDAVMRVEALVLVRDQQIEITRIDVL